MQFTTEQINIINSTGNIRINAVAGSGKTTTVIEYARSRPKETRILYLAFNRSVKLEAEAKFRKQKIVNVKVETAHSLAFRNIVFKYGYGISKQGYKSHDIVQLLRMSSGSERHEEYIVAKHINSFLTYFCNSDKRTITELNYRDVVHDPKALAFVKRFYRFIESKTQELYDKMDKGEIEITHDFYLKKFQLSSPVLPYDLILFDEAQDASAAMLDIFLQQKATKVMVGDTHQQIYGWRHAVNSLNKANFPTWYLSTSFRFRQDIADLAMRSLAWKEKVGSFVPIEIKGVGCREEIRSRAIIARTNLGLLLKAIEYVTEQKNIDRIYFEGNIYSYTYADDGASLYDVLNLYNHRKYSIKDKLIKEMRDMNDLKEYIDKTEDAQLKMMVEIVEEYGNEIPGILKRIKEKHVEGDDKEKAEMIFSTVHRCKGMEYDEVELVNDFISEEKIEKQKKDMKDALNIDKVNEEINLLYVAVTRAKKKLILPEEMFPGIEFPQGSIERKCPFEIPTVVVNHPDLPDMNIPGFKLEDKGKKYNLDEIRKRHGKAYMPWTEELDEELRDLDARGIPLNEIAKILGRTRGAIMSRLEKLDDDDFEKEMDERLEEEIRERDEMKRHYNKMEWREEMQLELERRKPDSYREKEEK